MENLDFLQDFFQVYFFLTHIISLFNQNNYEKMWEPLQLKTQKKVHQQEFLELNNNVIKTQKGKT